jgi:hypothetical protein
MAGGGLFGSLFSFGGGNQNQENAIRPGQSQPGSYGANPYGNYA